jgi:hypothetical protein
MAASTVTDNWINLAQGGIIRIYPNRKTWSLMLGQLLITLLVIVAAVIVVRRQRAAQRNPAKKPQSGETTDPWQGKNRQSTSAPQAANTQAPMANTMKSALWLILAGIIVIGSISTFLHWQDQQRLVTVLLYRDADQSPVIYRVAKRNIGEGSFITEDGTQVTVSANERMEIVGL